MRNAAHKIRIEGRTQVFGGDAFPTNHQRGARPVDEKELKKDKTTNTGRTNSDGSASQLNSLLSMAACSQRVATI